MSQELKEETALQRKDSLGRRLAEIILIMMGACCLYIMLSLVSFNPMDPSWSQTTWQQPIRNWGGYIGAWIADILFFLFGVSAYFLPFMLLIPVLSLFRWYISAKPLNYFTVALRLIGAFLLLLSSCGLMAFHFDDSDYFSSGGVVGSVLYEMMQSNFNIGYALLMLLSSFVLGITFFTGCSWSVIAEKLGEQAVKGTHFCFALLRRHTIKTSTYSERQQPIFIPPTQNDKMLFSTSDVALRDRSIFDSQDISLVSPQDEQAEKVGRIRTHAMEKMVEEDDLDRRMLPRINFPLSGDVKMERYLGKDAHPSNFIDDMLERKQYEPSLNVPIKETTELLASQDTSVSAVEEVLTHDALSVEEKEYDDLYPFLDEAKETRLTQSTEMRGSSRESVEHPFLLRDQFPLPKSTTVLPSLELLSMPSSRDETPEVDISELEETARLIEVRLADYRIKAKVVEISPGPVITRFELELAPGIKAARISNLSRDLARSLSVMAVRVVEVIPGKPYVGLELPNRQRQTVHLREVLDCPQFREHRSPLAVALGKDIGGQPIVSDLAKMPHLLVAGTTGSGKSVGINTMIISILYKEKPEDVKFIMIDPKMLELSVYEGIPHLLTQVVTDMKDAANALRWCVNEMERRYKLMSKLGVRNITGYNERILQAAEMQRPIPDPLWKPNDDMNTSPPYLEKFPYIVVMVDEFADLIMAVGKKVEELIARLAQKARAAGIHLVLATQRPSVDVITGLIKANIPTRIAFTVSSKVDSRTILDQGGAESLLGMGDMLYLPPNSSIPVRVHGAFVRDQEVHAVVQDWKARGQPRYVDNILQADDSEMAGTEWGSGEELDPLFDQVVAFVVDKRRASISGVQRQFRIGYNRAARIIEQMEAQGIVSAQGQQGNREVLAPPSFD